MLKVPGHPELRKQKAQRKMNNYFKRDGAFCETVCGNLLCLQYLGALFCKMARHCFFCIFSFSAFWVAKNSSLIWKEQVNKV